MHSTPPAIGDRCTVTISDIAFGGEGVGRLGEFVVFVPFVDLGEEVEIQLTEVKKNFGRGQLLNVVRTSPHRVDPLCPYFGTCGGCQYQHLDYPHQLEIKHKQITDLFQRIGKISSGTVDPVIGSPEAYHYRNRIMIRSQWNKKKQGLEIGFLEINNEYVVDIQECKIAEPALNQQLQEVRAHPPAKGGIKVVLRIPPEGWELPRDSFFQNNFFLLPKFVEVVRERLRSAGTKHLIDAYCGVGFFSIELSDLVESFVGVEADAMAVKAARKNAQARNITHGQYIIGRTEELLKALLYRFNPQTTSIILDPPRTGCAKDSLEALRKAGLAQIIYVSCHPATLARDLKLLTEGGCYEVVKVIPLDMFPQTQHVECVADLRLVASPH